jgi:PadR family transcriptional regulator, regulatory protein PadR
MAGIDTRALHRELKRGAAELLILSLLDARPRHGYELSKLIHTRSGGQLTFHIDSLYPLLYRLEERGWIKGTWVEKPDERRRRVTLEQAFQRVLTEPSVRYVCAQQIFSKAIIGKDYALKALRLSSCFHIVFNGIDEVTNNVPEALKCIRMQALRDVCTHKDLKSSATKLLNCSYSEQFV